MSEELSYLKKLQAYINSVLKPIIPSVSERNQYISSDAMLIWSTAFTHETYSPTYNYEELEFLGDAMLKAVFPKYIMKRFPNFRKNDFTNLNTSYMSKMYQATLAREMGMGPYIRVKGLNNVILNLYTDVFESFFGALDTISDMIAPGLGFANCYNMIVHLFSTREIDESNRQGSAKTQVIQMFVRFDLPKPIEERNDQPSGVTFSVVLEYPHLQFLQAQGINITNPVIGSATASTKADAEFQAYNMALRTLDKYGVNTEWAEHTKNVIDFSIPEVYKQIPAMMARYQAEGYVSVYFFISRKTSTKEGSVVQLIGVKENGDNIVLESLFTSKRDDGYREAKIKLAELYATGK